MAKRSSRPRANASPRVAVIVSRYNYSVTDALLEGAIGEFARRGHPSSELETFEAPGAFELPTLAAGAAASNRFDAVVALGCVIKGETSHDRYIAHAIADGLTRVSLDHRMPVAFGVLTTDTPKQARDRAGGKHGNKGAEAMAAALDTLSVLRDITAASRGTSLSRRPDKASPRS